MAELITGIFYNRASAEAAVDKLENFGYERDDISVIMHDRTMAKEFAADTGTTAGTAHKAADAAKSAAKVGGALAAILAGAAAIGAMRRDDTSDRSNTAVGTDRTASGLTPATTTTTTTTMDRSTAGTTDLGGTYRAGQSGIGVSESGYAGSASNGLEDTGARPGVGATSTGSVPDAKPFIAGPLATILLPALGAGLLSAFSKAGIPKEYADRYAQGLENNGIVIGVQAHPGDESRVRQALNQ